MKKGVGGRPKSQFWEYVEKLADGRIRCKLCGLAFRGSGSRIKYHLNGIPGKGISRCPEFTTQIVKKKNEEEEKTTPRQSNSIQDVNTNKESENLESQPTYMYTPELDETLGLLLASPEDGLTYDMDIWYNKGVFLDDSVLEKNKAFSIDLNSGFVIPTCNISLHQTEDISLEKTYQDVGIQKESKNLESLPANISTKGTDEVGADILQYFEKDGFIGDICFKDLTGISNLSEACRIDIIETVFVIPTSNISLHQTEDISLEKTYPDAGTKKELENQKSPPTSKSCKGDLSVPFSVSHHVEEDDWKLIKYVFDPSSGPSNETLVSSSHFHLTRSEFTTLKPENFLDGMVINIVVDRLTDLGKKKSSLDWYLPLTFSTYVSNDLSGFKETVEQHKIRQNYMSRLADCEKIFIPIHTGPNLCGHFYLCVVRVKESIVEIWDSLPTYISRRVEEVKNILLGLDTIFMNDIKNNFYHGWSFAKFHIKMPENIPIQPNGYDCGMYVIKYMKLAEATKCPNFKFHSDEERLALALDILKGDINEKRDDLHNAVEAYYMLKREEDRQHAKGPLGSAMAERNLDSLISELHISNSESGVERFGENWKKLKRKMEKPESREVKVKKGLQWQELLTVKKRKREVENRSRNVEWRKNDVCLFQKTHEEGRGKDIGQLKKLVEEVELVVQEELPHMLTADDEAKFESQEHLLLTTKLVGDKFQKNNLKILEFLRNDKVVIIGVYGLWRGGESYSGYSYP
ncbi:Ubiquitin-like-specific protease [Quillaja saponaria]|uniref:Ubiquitin-like-specific protease n=1 Tax=Quillaja saponaria TaxID=32244 RepID=A0AAD7LHZ7_QUISA|nr:Ubiquitin-like-specific protease [Quillaja saponaria]